MKLENLSEAYRALDKYTLNEEAEKAIAQLTNNGLNILIPQENLYDRLVNTFDSKRVVLERKADILHHYYKDTTLAKDLTFDYVKEIKNVNLFRNLTIFSLLGYSGFTALVHKTPFMKAPGVIASVLGVHCATRSITNKKLEKKLETPWKIHTYRMSKGLGPTNVKWNAHNEYYGSKKNINEVPDTDYLFKEDKILKNASIYIKDDLLRRKTGDPNPYSLLSPIFSDFAKTYNTPNITKLNFTNYHDTSNGGLPNKHGQDEEFLAGTNKKTEDASNERFDAWMKHNKRNDAVMRPQTHLKYTTFSPRNNDLEEENTIISKNDYEDVNNFLKDNKPHYTNIYDTSINFNNDMLEKFYLDWNLNVELDELKRQVYFFSRSGLADREEIESMISRFNDEAKKRVEQQFEASISEVRNERPKESFLITCKNDENHLRAFFNFTEGNKITMLKHISKVEDTSFEVDVDNYDPWAEYKKVYGNLFEKGRKYFIIQSMPEWKFLQVRKPVTRNSIQSYYYKVDNSKPDPKDSIFHMWSLERYHRERYRKENIYHQEHQTHKI